MSQQLTSLLTAKTVPYQMVATGKVQRSPLSSTDCSSSQSFMSQTINNLCFIYLYIYFWNVINTRREPVSWGEIWIVCFENIISLAIFSPKSSKWPVGRLGVGLGCSIILTRGKISLSVNAAVLGAEREKSQYSVHTFWAMSSSSKGHHVIEEPGTLPHWSLYLHLLSIGGTLLLCFHWTCPGLPIA